ncbi:DUF6668 family protein [Spirillospora sp. NPDC029432]|uniref:DUF6668 family protein n=1 Tax=Spirillospora sp. NPDC029432 TaxID=3154599 RepID=UPI003454A06B
MHVLGAIAASGPFSGLPLWPLPNGFTGQGPVFFIGCHGGAGTSTLHRLLPNSVDAGRYWPAPQSGFVNAVLVARTHADGLRWAQGAIRQWADGSIPPAVNLLGLAAVADAPGRLPKPLKQLLDLISGGVPNLWQLPWVEAWRLGDPVDRTSMPSAYLKMSTELQQLIPGASGV